MLTKRNLSTEMTAKVCRLTVYPQCRANPDTAQVICLTPSARPIIHSPLVVATTTNGSPTRLSSTNAREKLNNRRDD